MKIFVTGVGGQLGYDVMNELKNRGIEAVGSDILPECDKYENYIPMDITNAEQVKEVISSVKPDAVIHCAAWTAVDAAEDEENKPKVKAINADGTRNIANVCKEIDAKMMYISTDYVFDGESGPYNEFARPTGGINVYGQSKWAGEQAVRTHCPDHVIARISWLYGPGGPSFVHTMLRLARQGHEVLRVVDDQRGNPTSTSAVAAALRHILLRPGLVGTFHLTCEGETTWYGFAREIFRLAGMEQSVVPCTSAEYVTPARRPENSCLEKRMLRLLGLPSMPHWQESLADFMRSQACELGIPAAPVPDAGR